MHLSKNRFYVGTTRGVLLYTGDNPSDLKVSKNDETVEITALAEGCTSEDIILGYQNGHAHVFNTEKYCFSQKINNLEGDGSIIGICSIGKSVLFGKQDGIINIWTNKKNDFFSINLDEKGSMDVMTSDNNASTVGTGGEFNDFKLWNIETRQCIFKGKSLGHDQLQLPIPTSVKGITFFHNEDKLAACCTKEGHVLLYDIRVQRKPVVKFLEKKASYTTISPAYRDRQVLLGTSKGYMQWLDLRGVKLIKTYTAFTGSITGIVCDPVDPYVATVSLDRHLRVHQMETKVLVYKNYMKQNLTKLLVKPIIKEEQYKNKNETQCVDPEYEDLFQNMEEIREAVADTKSKRKLVNSSDKTRTLNKKRKSI